MDIKRSLLDFSALTGVSGQEGEAADFGARLLSPYGRVSRNPAGSVLCRVWDAPPGAPSLLLDAHIDEVGLIVAFIEESGLLRASVCGGTDRRSLPAAQVSVHGEKGAVYGVVCLPPRKDGEPGKTPGADEIHIDIGCTREQAAALVAPGDRVTLHATALPLLGDLVCGKALDDRAGCVAILYALSLLEGVQPGCGLAVSFSSLEEIGGQGAKTAAWEIAPTHAIAVDVSFAHTPGAPREKCGLLGKGPMIGYAPVLSSAMSAALRETARREGIPFQTEVMGGKTGTNADHIAASRGGVETGLLSIPQKYMHTPVETVSVRDVKDTGRLIAAFIRRLAGEGGAAL